MAYFKVGTTDLSGYVSALKVTTKYNYTKQANAAGNTVVDLQGNKATIQIELIPMDAAQLKTILGVIGFSNSISYMNPYTNQLRTGVTAICDNTALEYYTIQTGNTMLNAVKLKFVEL